MIAAIGAGLCLGAAARRREKWSPLQQLGRTSLFIYWIHVEMVYGAHVAAAAQALSSPQALVALALFSLFMLFCSIAKDRVVLAWSRRRSGEDPVAASNLAAAAARTARIKPCA